VSKVKLGVAEDGASFVRVMPEEHECIGSGCLRTDYEVIGHDCNDCDAEYTERHHWMKQAAVLRADRDAAIARGVEVWFQARWTPFFAKWELENAEAEAALRAELQVAIAKNWTNTMVRYRDLYSEERQRIDVLRRQLGRLASRAHRAQGHKERWYDCADSYCAQYRAYAKGSLRFV